eukprot:53411-Pyramimonas_sp.AAC.1
MPPELESGCDALTNAMRPVRTNWRWMIYKTLAGGQTSFHSMHGRLLNSCMFGCSAAPDSVLPHPTSTARLQPGAMAPMQSIRLIPRTRFRRR